MSHAPRFHRLAVNDLRREAAGRGVADLCDPERAGRRLQLCARTISDPAHDDGRRGSAPLLFDLLRPRRRRAAHRREEGRWRRVLELGRRRIEGRRRARRDDADRPLRHRAMRPARRGSMSALPPAPASRRSCRSSRACWRASRTAASSCSTATARRRACCSAKRWKNLKDRFMQRLSLFHVISGEEQDIPILHGRLDGEKVRVLLRSLVPAASVDHVFICGPAGHERGHRGDLP